MNEDIYKQLGSIETSVQWIERDAKIKNGYITDLNKRITENEERTTENEKLIIEFKFAMEAVFDFMKEQREEKKDRESFKGNIKANWINYIVTLITGGIISRLF